MTGSNSHIPILTLNVNGLNAQSKTWTGKSDKKPKPIDVLYPETLLTCKDTQRLKIKG